MVEHRAQRAKTPNASIKYSPSFFFFNVKLHQPSPESWLLNSFIIFLCVWTKETKDNTEKTKHSRSAGKLHLRGSVTSLRNREMHCGQASCTRGKKKPNAHMKYSPSRFWQMKSFAILVHSPVSTVTNSPEIWMQITYLKGPNSHFQYNASFWSIVRSRVYTPPLPFASDCIFQMPRADESPPRTHKSFSDNEAKC